MTSDLKKVFLRLLLMLVLGCPPLTANAATRTWTATTSANWSNPGNWSPIGVPQNGDALIFPDNGSLLSVGNNDLPDLTVDHLFFKHDYSLLGNTLGIVNGLQAGSGLETVDVSVSCPLTLKADADALCSWGQGLFFNVNDLHLNGLIDLNGHTLTLTADSVNVIGSDHGNIHVAGVIAGSGNVSAVVQARAFIEFSGTQGNTFSGALTAQTASGTHVSFNKVSGSVVNDRLVLDYAVIETGHDGQIGGSATVVLNRGSQLKINGHTETIGSLVMTNLHADADPCLVDTRNGSTEGTGLLTLNGGITSWVFNDVVVPTIRGVFSLPSGEHTLNIRTPEAYAGFEMKAEIRGFGNFSKTGNAALLLTASNSCNSTISVLQGTLDVRHPHALGDTAGPTQIFGGALLLRNVAIADETLFALGQGTGGAFPGSVLTSVGACSWSGPVVLYTNLVVSGALDFTGVISGSGGLGCFASTVHLTGNNTYTGTNYISGATLQVDGVQPSSPVDLHDQGRLQGSGIVGNINVKGASTAIAPGGSPGILTCNDLDASGGNGLLEIELNSSTPGSGYDQLNVNGTVNLTGLSLGGSRGFSPAQGDSFTIIANDGSDAVTGAFTGLRQDSQVRLGGESFHVNYVGGTGNDVVITRRGHDITWTNNASGDWNVAANWSPNLVPGTNDTVFINKTVTVTLNTVVNCYNLTMGTAGSPTLTGTGDLTLFVFNFNGFNLSGSLAVTVLHQMTWIGGTMTGSGRTLIQPGAILNLANVNVINLTGGRTLENGGTILWTSGNFGMNGGIITNRAGALFDARTTTGLNYASNPGSRFDNAGTFRKSTGGTTTLFGGLVFNNYGAVEIQAGTLVLGGGGTHNGTFDVPAGTTLSLSGGTHTTSGGSSITGAGNLYVSGGNSHAFAGLVNVTGTNQFDSGTANLTGNYICTNNTLFMSGGTANFNGTGTVTPAVVNMDSGTLGGGQTVMVLSQMNWTGGTMTGSGRTFIPAGATLNIAAVSATVSLTGGRTLENGGTTLWTAGNFAMSSAVITNRAGALFEARNALGLNYSSNPGSRFDNAGTFRKSVVVGTTTVGGGMAFNNYNTVDIQSGILLANGGYTTTSNALLTCALGGTAVGTGYGRLQVAGTVTNMGALGVSLANGFIPTTNDTFTVLTAGTRSGTFANFYFPSNDVTMVLSNTASSVIVRVLAVLALPPPILHIEKITALTARLYWLTNYPGFHLEYNPNLATTNWAASALTPVVTSTNFVVTNALFGAQKYYRLSRVPATYTPPPPSLTIQRASTNAVRLLWSAEDDRTFTLQSNTNLTTTNWATAAPAPALLGSDNVVTNTISGTQKFYRLFYP